MKELLKHGQGDRELNQPIVIKNGEGESKIVLKKLKDVANQYFMALSLAH